MQIDKEMFSDSPNVNEFPFYGDTENYFPAQSIMVPIDYSPIELR